MPLKYFKHFDGYDEITASQDHTRQAGFQNMWIMWSLLSLSVLLTLIPYLLKLCMARF